MIWPLNVLERRAQTWLLSQLPSWSELGIGFGPTAAGVEVNADTALHVPAVAACIRILAQDVAKTPLRLRRRIGPGSYVDADDHGLWEILHDLANPEQTAFDFKNCMMRDLMRYGVAYAQIVRQDGRVTALWHIDADRVTVDRDASRRKRWHVTLADGQRQTFLFDPSTPPIFELRHPTPIQESRDVIGNALALQEYCGTFFSQGAKLGGILETDGVLGAEGLNHLRASFEARQSGLRNAHRTLILEQGLKWKAVSQQNDQAQMVEVIRTISEQIAAVFRVPPWRVGLTEKTSYSNMEQGAIDYAVGTLDPLFVVWESALRRDVLTTRQYGTYDVQFDRSTLIRSDIKSLHEALRAGRDGGFYSVNDARRKLGENPIGPEGDIYTQNGNLTPVGQQENAQ